MKNCKRFLALSLAATMVMGSSMIALAEEGKGTGTGSLDIVEKSDVFNVVLPTSSGTAFNYILDPTSVIDETEAAKYGDKKFEPDKTLYFANTENDKKTETVDGTSVTYDYSDTSDKITVINKSTMDVEIKVNAKVAEVEGITMATTGTFTDTTDKSASIYLALTDGTTPTAITTAGINVTETITKTDGVYKIVYENGKYVKKLDDTAAATATFDSYSFQLTGACNPSGEWAGLTDKAPSVDIVWSVENPVGPSISISTSGVISITKLDGTLYSSMSLNDGTKDWPLTTGKDGTWEWEDAENGKKEFKLGSNWMPSYLAGKTVVVTVTLKDGTKVKSPSVTIPAASN